MSKPPEREGEQLSASRFDLGVQLLQREREEDRAEAKQFNSEQIRIGKEQAETSKRIARFTKWLVIVSVLSDALLGGYVWLTKRSAEAAEVTAKAASGQVAESRRQFDILQRVNAKNLADERTRADEALDAAYRPWLAINDAYLNWGNGIANVRFTLKNIGNTAARNIRVTGRIGSLDPVSQRAELIRAKPIRTQKWSIGYYGPGEGNPQELVFSDPFTDAEADAIRKNKGTFGLVLDFSYYGGVHTIGEPIRQSECLTYAGFTANALLTPCAEQQK